MGYRWMPITSNFDRSLPFTKVRWNSTYRINQSVTECMFSELPNINCDGKGWTQVNSELYGYAGAYRFVIDSRWMFSDYRAGFSDRPITAATYIDATTNEYEFSKNMYWGGCQNSNTSQYPYLSSGACIVYVQVSVFEPSKSTFNFSSLGGSESFELTANTGWTATTASDWVSLDNMTGTTGGTLVLTCSPNEGNSRTATITFTDANSETFNITVNQKKRGVLVPIAKVKKGALTVNKEYFHSNE